MNDKILVEYYSNQEENATLDYIDNTIIANEREDVKACVGICHIKRKMIFYIPKSFNGIYEFNTTSGDISAEMDLLDNKVNIITTSGDTHLAETSDVNIVTVSGDIHLGKINKMVNTRTTSGSIHIGVLDNKENSNITTTSGDVKIDNNKSNCYIKTDTTSGDTKISKNNPKSNIILNIKTTSGDVKVG